VRFLIDAQLPPALARLLNDRAHVAEHVNGIGLGQSLDRDLWRYALEHEAAIVTKDEDLPTWPSSAVTPPPSCKCVSGTHDARHY
jgi:predicted nuclease of predicted toxin-antitoxin system